MFKIGKKRNLPVRRRKGKKEEPMKETRVRNKDCRGKEVRIEWKRGEGKEVLRETMKIYGQRHERVEEGQRNGEKNRVGWGQSRWERKRKVRRGEGKGWKSKGYRMGEKRTPCHDMAVDSFESIS